MIFRASALLALCALLAVGCPHPVPEACPAGHDCKDASTTDASASCGCTAGQRCLAGSCYPDRCGDQPCRPNTACVGNVCRDADCLTTTCADGQACAGGRCYPADCGAVACAAGEICYDGACLQPACIGVACNPGTVCVDGTCVKQSCAGVTCASGAACESGACVAVACLGVICGSGTLCAGGRCEPTSCSSAAPCPQGKVCDHGACLDASCFGLVCPQGTHCQGAACVAGEPDCRPGDPPSSCGVGGQCASACLADGTRGDCLPPGATSVDLSADPLNCGTCAAACPVPVNAPVRCLKGVCGRGPCSAGFFDFDGPATFGCETGCTGKSCTGPSGQAITLTDPPVHERTLMHAPSNATSWGASVQTSASYTNQALVGEPTPAPSSGGAVSASPSNQNVAGLGSLLRH